MTWPNHPYLRCVKVFSVLIFGHVPQRELVCLGSIGTYKRTAGCCPECTLVGWTYPWTYLYQLNVECEEHSVILFSSKKTKDRLMKALQVIARRPLATCTEEYLSLGSRLSALGSRLSASANTRPRPRRGQHHRRGRLPS